MRGIIRTLLTAVALICVGPEAVRPQPPKPLGTAFQINTYTTGYQYQSDVAASPSGGFIVVWQSFEDGYGAGVFARRFDASGLPLGAPFQVNSSTTGSEQYPAVALDGQGGFVVVWQRYGEGIRARRFDASGTPIASDFLVNEFTPFAGSSFQPAVTADADGDFVVVWQAFDIDSSNWGIVARRFGSSGVPITADFLVNSFFTGYQGRPDVSSAADGRFVVVWDSNLQDGSSYGVFAQRFASTGSFSGTEFLVNPVTNDEQYRAAVAMDQDGDFVVAWQSRAGQDGSSIGVMARRFESTGAPLDYELIVQSNTAGGQSVADVTAEADGDFVVTWLSDGDGGPTAGTLVRRFSFVNGLPQGPDLLVDGSNASRSYPRVAADADGDFLVVWNEFDGSEVGVFARRYAGPSLLDIDGNGLIEPLTDGLLFLRFAFGFTGSNLTSGAIGAGCARCDAATVAPYLAGIATAELPGSPALPAGSDLQVNSYTVGYQHGPLIAADTDGDFVVVWQSEGEDGSDSGVFGRRFASSGAASGPAFLVNAYTEWSQRYANLVVASDGDFVVAWASFVPGARKVFARSFNASGTPLGPELQVNIHTPDYPGRPAAAATTNGDFIVVWESFRAGITAHDVFLRRLSSTGVPQSGEFRVNSYVDFDQKYPAIASETNGDFVVVWISQIQNDSLYSIFGQRFASTGSPLAAEFQVNTTTMQGKQYYPALAMDADGDFVVAWTNYSGGDGSGYGVLARRFNSSGAPLGVDFVASAYTTYSQRRADVHMEADGDFVVVWDSQRPNGALEIFARRFASSGAPRSGDIQVNSFATSYQFSSAVAGNPHGDFVVAWTSFAQDGDVGVFARRLVVPLLFDVDGDGSFSAPTDGVLVLRFIFGFTGNALVANAVGPGCSRCDAVTIKAYLESL